MKQSWVPGTGSQVAFSASNTEKMQEESLPPSARKEDMVAWSEGTRALDRRPWRVVMSLNPTSHLGWEAQREGGRLSMRWIVP